MRFGIRLRLPVATTPTWQIRRQSRTFRSIIWDENCNWHVCHHYHRTREAAQKCALREERRGAEAARVAEHAEIQAELRRLNGELVEIHFRCQTCANGLYDRYEPVSGEIGAVGIRARCTSCGALHTARKEGSGA
jgi:hypothetical protein